jgi:replicative DNA helicase
MSQRNTTRVVRSGFTELDCITGGFQPGQLIFVASRYSVGKTALALNIAEYVAFNEDLPVAVFCLASCSDGLKMRLASSVSGVCLHSIQTNQMSDQNRHRFDRATSALQKCKLFIEGDARVTVKILSDRARWLSDQHGNLGLIVIDDLQCTHFSAKRGQAVADELGALSRGLKYLAQEHGCPVIVPTQLGRALEMRRNKRPRLTDLRSGGKQEQLADMIITVYRDDYYTHNASPSPGIGEINVIKNTTGATGCVRLAFNQSLTKFENLSTIHQDFI